MFQERLSALADDAKLEEGFKTKYHDLMKMGKIRRLNV